MRRPLVWVALALLAAAAVLGAVALRGPAPARGQADQAHAIAASLRCPVCNDLSVADSPAPLAKQMRETIARDLRAGKSADRIREEFVAAYGESILLAPPGRGIGLVAWLAPAVLLAAGLALALASLHRWRAHPAGPVPPGAAPVGSGGGGPARRRGGDGTARPPGGDGTARPPGASGPGRPPADRARASSGEAERPSAAQRRLLERALAQLDEEEGW